MTSNNSLQGKRVLILGGTGSLGQRLCKRILANEQEAPATVTVFSRDEAKQHYMRLAFHQRQSATDDIIYRESTKRLRFAIGDVRNYDDVKRETDRADVIFHAAALKQVPTCEYFAAAAVDTNVQGAINLARAIREGPQQEKAVVGISTDKACKPVNLMGMTKAIQERVLAQANLDSPWCRYVNVRYGNVMASRGSAIPMFIDLIRHKQPIPVTHAAMTRFLMTLNQSVDLVFNAYRYAKPGETYLPVVPCAKVLDMIHAIAGDESYPCTIVGIRPGEKIHEILVSEEEVSRTEVRNENLVILPILPELRQGEPVLTALPFVNEYTSANDNLSYAGVVALLTQHNLTATTAPHQQEIYT